MTCHNTDQLRLLSENGERSFYLYDQSKIAENAQRLSQAFNGFEFIYSVKTNPFPPVARTVFSQGFGADAASAAEVELAHHLGLPKSKILYSAPGKTDADLTKSLDKSIVIADSYGELTRLNQLAAAKNTRLHVGVRLNPEFTMTGDNGTTGKFGIDSDSLPANRDLLTSLTNLTIIGIHVHVRSQVLDAKLLRTYYKRIFQLATRCQDELGWQLEFINFGGGLGVVYSDANDQPLDVAGLGAYCTDLKNNEFKTLGNIRLVIETGRYLVCHAGTYASPIVDIKTSRGVKYLLVRNGLNGFLRPALANLLQSAPGANLDGFNAEPLFTVRDAFDLTIAGKERGSDQEKVTVVGSLCTAADVLAAGVMLPRAEVGDVVLVSKAGSYAYPLSPLQFSSHPAPAQYLRSSDGNLITE